MNDINTVNLTGNLTADPELRYTTTGMAVLDFRIASNHSVKRDGQWVDVPNFISCVVLGARAEALAKLLNKGNKVAISGALRYRSWEKDGQRRSTIEVSVDQVVLMSRAPQATQNETPQNDVQDTTQLYDRDIPF